MQKKVAAARCTNGAMAESCAKMECKLASMMLMEFSSIMYVIASIGPSPVPFKLPYYQE
jgi:hypothetical protein